MTTRIHPWSQLLQGADDYWHGRSPDAPYIAAVQSAARDLQFTITNGLAALNALLIEHDDALDGDDAMNLLRLLASLGDACLCLRLFEEDTAEIAKRLSKEKPA